MTDKKYSNNTIEENTVRKYILKKYFSKYIDDTGTRKYVLNIVKIMLSCSDKDSVIKVIKNYKRYGDLYQFYSEQIKKLGLYEKYYNSTLLKQSLILLMRSNEKQTT